MQDLKQSLTDSVNKEFDCLYNNLATHGKILSIFNNLYFVEVTQVNTRTQRSTQIPFLKVDLSKVSDIVIHVQMDTPKEKSAIVAYPDDIITFGKYKFDNIKWRQLIKENLGYVQWVRDNVTQIKLSDEILIQI